MKGIKILEITHYQYFEIYMNDSNCFVKRCVFSV